MGLINAIIALCKAVPVLERLFCKYQMALESKRQRVDMRISLLTLMLLCVFTGCQTKIEYNNVKRLTAHPQFPKAAFHAPDFTRNAMRTIAELEYELERR